MTQEHELKKFLGVREWLYLCVLAESGNSRPAVERYRVDAVTSDTEIYSHSTRLWNHYLTGEALPIGWLFDAIQEWYGR